MLSGIGLGEILLIALVVLLVFGVGRITKVAGELGSGINAFRKGLKGDINEEESNNEK
ncbi:MAG: twin-arginine translocase TatA/TatE family subunit [Anaerolineaceae bacterium]|nr:twin-arginine translocase TatA/TatE family subunit [Anaerolineaceae bacterium]